ncbi:3-isopropylmalate dehydratase small subunit [Paracoccus sediminicola]|uniref:3-isopropylmalate dehydratase small subunit n=1 Tax=Paracoccus sediminicola TaxID=3017783 RepID=UPI0022F07509|nr:3-isopropylmalate dehydratase small subunit [Paracoccus sediminicola]WBU56300.1 3-isopropylmalate dehydratase small subunit [Paracoccus sediminicola]
MEPFTRIAAPAVPLPRYGLDTDQLIPSRFMKEPRKSGYGKFLLYDLRHDENGSLNADFILNRAEASEARTLVARRNFGAGSSREAAVYALVDFGFRCVVAPSFGDIFSANAVNNGLLPATVSEEHLEVILTLLGDELGPMVVDLEKLSLSLGDQEIPFTVNDNWRKKLLNGWDDITLTLQHSDAVETFAAERFEAFPWAAPIHQDRNEGGTSPRV